MDKKPALNWLTIVLAIVSALGTLIFVPLVIVLMMLTDQATVTVAMFVGLVYVSIIAHIALLFAIGFRKKSEVVSRVP